MVIWLLVARPGTSKIQILYLMKAVGANNIGTTIVGDVMGGLIDDIAK